MLVIEDLIDRSQSFGAPRNTGFEADIKL